MSDIRSAIESDLTNFGDLYWAYNLPLQMWPRTEDTWAVVNYMPRKEAIERLDQSVSIEQLPAFCAKAAETLRNLADLFDAMAAKKIDCIYYPTESVADAMQEHAAIPTSEEK